MKYNNKEETLKKVVELYLQGKTMEEISVITGWSRHYIGNCIKDIEEIKEYRNKKIIKLIKLKTRKAINISIPIKYWNKIGISSESNIIDKVEITVDEQNKTLTIKKS